MSGKLLIVLVVMATIALGHCQESAQSLEHLIEQHNKTLQMVFFSETEKPMEVHTTKFHLSRLKRMQAEAKAYNVVLTDDDESLRDMLNFLVEASHLSEKKCYGDVIAESELFTGYISNFKNVVDYLHYFVEQQINLCKSIGIEVHV